MLIDIAAAVAWGALLCALANHLTRPILGGMPFRRKNYCGKEVGVASGLILVVALLLSGAVGAALVAADLGSRWRLVNVAVACSSVIVPVVGFALLGLLDDLGATGDTRGFRGHLRSVVRGELSTGALKLFGGGAFALWLAGTSVRSEIAWPMVWLLINGAIIALSANMANLFDRSPGRAIKVSVLSLVVILVGLGVGVWREENAYVPFVLGVALVLLRDDLNEVSMLGDTGSNPLGAVSGFAALQFDHSVRIGLLALLVALSAASERVSFSRVIERTRPLRWIDRLGTRVERKVPNSQP